MDLQCSSRSIRYFLLLNSDSHNDSFFWFYFCIAVVQFQSPVSCTVCCVIVLCTVDVLVIAVRNVNGNSCSWIVWGSCCLWLGVGCQLKLPFCVMQSCPTLRLTTYKLRLFVHWHRLPNSPPKVCRNNYASHKSVIKCVRHWISYIFYRPLTLYILCYLFL